MSVFAFDFSGSGKSDGEYISLGVFEKFDVETVVSYLASCDHVSSIALWGHSMGAATATMYAGMVDPSRKGGSGAERARVGKLAFLPKPKVGGLVRGGSFIKRNSMSNAAATGTVSSSTPGSSATAVPSASPPSSPASAGATATATAAQEPAREPARVKALVLDSAFASFDKLANAMVENMPLPAAVPRKLILSVGVRAVRKAVRDQAGFDVNDIDPLSACRCINASMPAIFLQGTHDEIVHLAHAGLLLDAFPGHDKELVVMADIDHDTPRPSYAIEKAFILLQRALFDDYGAESVRFATALKMRGNDAMVESRFTDAIFLYTNALEAVIKKERSERELDGSSLVCVRGMSTMGGPSPVHPVATPASAIRENIWPDSEDEECRGNALPDVDGGDPLPRPPSAANRISSRFTSSVRKLSRAGSARRRPAGEEDGQAAPTRRRPATFIRNKSQSGANDLLGGGGAVTPAGSSDYGDRAEENGVSAGEAARLRLPRLPIKRGSFRQSRDAEAGNQSPRGRQSATQRVSGEVPVRTVAENEASVEIARSVRAGFTSDERKDSVLALLGNRSLARLKKKDYLGGLEDAELAIELDSTWVRGYQRKATALKSLGRIDDARLTIMEGLRVAPDCSPLLAMECELEEEALAAAMEASMQDQAMANRGGQRYSAAVCESHASVDGVTPAGFLGEDYEGSELSNVEGDGLGATTLGNEAVA